MLVLFFMNIIFLRLEEYKIIVSKLYCGLNFYSMFI